MDDENLECEVCSAPLVVDEDTEFVDGEAEVWCGECDSHHSVKLTSVTEDDYAELEVELLSCPHLCGYDCVRCWG